MWATDRSGRCRGNPSSRGSLPVYPTGFLEHEQWACPPNTSPDPPPSPLRVHLVPGRPSPPPAPIHTVQPCLPGPWSPAPESRPCSQGVATVLHGIEWSGALSGQEELTVETAGQDLVF